MYSKEQTAKLTSQFWTSLGQYMKPVAGASGEPVNWINYKTGIRYIYFKMEVSNTKAIIAIEISHSNPAERLQYYHQFVALKKLLATSFHWQWNETVHTGHKTISSITQQLDNVNILNQADWPAIISFLKPRIIALDAFWDMVKDGFE
ncbi:DUF4268 domain-containing protein [Ferruginibacter sp. SUN106]|uniref:DUF4268 domain-containing protein n=1 Tax=Ferruginibacter sp. SUN106 TaxID=2978348 RepID=UPI003D369A0A